jgi:hypothetical protein
MKYKLVCFIIWGSDSSVLNEPHEEPGRTPLYVGLPSAWGSVDADYMFSSHFVGGLLFGDSDMYKRTNKPLALETEHLSPQRPCWGNMVEGSLTRDFEGFFCHIYLGSFYLDPEDVANLSMGDI